MIPGENDKLETLDKPRRFTVHLGRDQNGQPVTNVPWSVIDHSPDGYEWGYAGSGPADLALNILNAYIPPGTDGMEPVPCYRGMASVTAYELHQSFNRAFLCTMPREGDVMFADTIESWIMDKAPNLDALRLWMPAGHTCEGFTEEVATKEGTKGGARR